MSAALPRLRYRKAFYRGWCAGMCPILLPALFFPPAFQPALRACGERTSTSLIESRRVIVRDGGFFPVLIKLKNGEMVAVVRGKFPHVIGDGSLDLIRSTNNGKSWSTPRVIVDKPRQDDRNPAFGQLADGTLVLAWMKDDLHGFRGIFFARSHDNGRTWTREEEILSSGQHIRGSPFGKIVELPDGTALLNVYSSLQLTPAARKVPGSMLYSYLFRSRDGGKTWSDPSLIAEGFNETALLVLGPDQLLAALRSLDKSLFLTRSLDGGRNWTQPTRLTAREEHPGDLILLDDGNILLSYGVRHDPGVESLGDGDKDSANIHNMGAEAMMSSDGGHSWPPSSKVILDHCAPNFDTGYPSSVQLDNGHLLTLYYVVQQGREPVGHDLAGAQTRMVIWRHPMQKEK